MFSKEEVLEEHPSLHPSPSLSFVCFSVHVHGERDCDDDGVNDDWYFLCIAGKDKKESKHLKGCSGLRECVTQTFWPRRG